MKFFLVTFLSLFFFSCTKPGAVMGKKGAHTTWAPGIAIMDRLPDNGKIVGNVEMIRCNAHVPSNDLGGATKEMVLMDLTHKAKFLDADGITNVDIKKHLGALTGVVDLLVYDCLSTIVGRASAFQYTNDKRPENKKLNVTDNKTNNKMIEDLEKLNKLYKDGVLTKQEFENAKKKIIAN